MEIISYGSIKPMAQECMECGCEFTYLPTDCYQKPKTKLVERKTEYGTEKSEKIYMEYCVKCPACGSVIVAMSAEEIENLDSEEK